MTGGHESGGADTPGGTIPSELVEQFTNVVNELAALEQQIQDPSNADKLIPLVRKLRTLNQRLQDTANAADGRSDQTGMAFMDEDANVQYVKDGLKELGQGIDPPLSPNVADELEKQGIDPDPTLPEDLVTFVGLIGDSPRGPKHRRLYLTIQLNEYIEFTEDDLVYYRELVAPPLNSTMIWLRPQASIRHVRSETVNLQRAFLQGGISGAATSPAQMGSGPGQFGGGGPGQFGAGGQGQFGGGSWGPWCGGGSGLGCAGGRG